MKTVQGIVSVTGALALVALLATASPAAYDDAAQAYGRGDFAAAFQEYRRLGEAGDVRAQANVGWMYHAGQGTFPDPVQAAAWYGRAAEHGPEIARYNLAYAYETGAGVPKDLVKASHWYALAAQQGNVEAKEGRGRVLKLIAVQAAIPRPETAVKQAAPASVAPATRQEVPPIFSPAEKTAENPKITGARRAAESGDANAMVYLGWCYSSGKGVSQNKTEATVWYRLAAARGHVDAQTALGWMYYIGEGDVRDLSEAAAWYQMAADQGNLKAKRMLKKIAREAGPHGNQRVSQAR